MPRLRSNGVLVLAAHGLALSQPKVQQNAALGNVETTWEGTTMTTPSKYESCPDCGHSKCGGYDIQNGPPQTKPSTGMIVMCPICGCVCFFGDKLELVRASKEMLAKLPTSLLVQLMNTQRAIRADSARCQRYITAHQQN